MNEVVMMVGSPASGKGRVVALETGGYLHLNRDKVGGKVVDLLPAFEDALSNGRNIVLDNTYPTAESRKPFIDMAKKNKTPIRCKFMGTSTEDCSINALMRMWDRYGKLFMTPESLKEVKNDPNMFPIAALFSYKKEFEEPTTGEGFTKVEKVLFKRVWPATLTKRAVLFDFDDTLRTVKPGAKFKFPTRPSEIEILPRRKEVIQKYLKNNYIIGGASNQSGIARGQLTVEQATECFAHTVRQLVPKDVVAIKVEFCPHNVPPVCYCRKPQSGMGVKWIMSCHLDPKQTVYVGDQTTDKTFATRLGFQYVDQAEFFK
jgi:HAD superfamily hydrolase (TIGR01662 family)